jgi:hypothetical protein
MPLGAISMDFSKEFRLPEPPSYDQMSGDHCVACAWAYYKWQLKGKTYSKKDLFCRIALPYGAEIRAGGVELVKNGIADNKEVKDPVPPTPSKMRDKTGTKQEYRDDDKEYKLKLLQDQTIHGVAWGIANYKGVVFGVVGSNEGWKDKLNPRPPLFGEKVWGHALYGFGYHSHNGSECIIAKSSWKSTNEHHIKKDYFQALDMTFNAWVLVQEEGNMNNYVKTINIDGEVGYFVPLNDANPGEIELMNSMFNKNLVVKPDGGIDTDIRATKI